MIKILFLTNLIILLGCPKKHENDSSRRQYDSGPVYEERASNLKTGSIEIGNGFFRILQQDKENQKKWAQVSLDGLTLGTLNDLAPYPQHPLRFEALEQVGKGSQSKIYSYEGSIVKPCCRDDEDFSALLRMLKAQVIPGVVKIERIVKVEDGSLGIVFERLNPVDIAINKKSDQQFAEIALKLVETVLALHVAHLSHGDIFPGNIMARGSEPVLIDFYSGGNGPPALEDSSALAMALLYMRGATNAPNGRLLSCGPIEKELDYIRKNSSRSTYQNLEALKEYLQKILPHMSGQIGNAVPCPHSSWF